MGELWKSLKVKRHIGAPWHLVSRASHIFPSGVRMRVKKFCVGGDTSGNCRQVFVSRRNVIIFIYHVTSNHRAMTRLHSIFLPTMTGRSIKWALHEATLALGYEGLRQQQIVVEHFLRGNVVFVSLPTGSGQSLCYCLLPKAFDLLRDSD